MGDTRARQLRRSMTRQEVRLWLQLRQLREQGFHFRRQSPRDGYVLDFVCLKHRLIVEVDGSQHGHPQGQERDRRRDVHFARDGFRVLRFWNHEIDEDIDAVAETVFRRLTEPWPD